MCCFSGSVELVSDTNIFARGENGSQFLVYSMRYAAADDLAMVLPLPVPPNSPEDAVRFISLERYPKFFDDLRRGFPRRVTRSVASTSLVEMLIPPRLEVHQVGAYEASFVPRIADFDRLDPRFRLPEQVWDKLGEYQDYGFAVFKLKGTHEATDVHPMALAFPRRNAELLYFPTVHIHDGQVHPRATFDHTLYCQVDETMDEYVETWERSFGPAEKFMVLDTAAGIVDAGSPCFRTTLAGKLQNRDALVGKGGALPV